ncbi:MAG TPA: hypothetical protein VGE45_00410 [Chloroflexia bacterium]|jgi:hypothetical protein
MTSEELNEKLREIENRGAYSISELDRHGKMLPYVGWYWRDVDFATPAIRLGDCGSFKGFMEDNKWDHIEWSPSAEESADIVRLVHAVAEKPGPESLRALYNYIQGLKPPEDVVKEHAEFEARYSDMLNIPTIGF